MLSLPFFFVIPVNRKCEDQIKEGHFSWFPEFKL